MATGAATMIFPVVLAAMKVGGPTIYDWLGSLATYGFITVYALVAVALPLHLRQLQTLNAGVIILAAAAVAAMILVLAGTLYPIPEAPKNWLPYLFLLYLVVAVGWHGSQSGKRRDRMEARLISE
jgi:amino acid transporter